MTLVSKHTSGELSSPFYVENKEKCEEYESFIQEIGGESKGYYNAYSYNVMGTVDSRSKWQLRLKKSTFSSAGNLLLSSKYQSLMEIAQWSSDNVILSVPKFTIKRKNWTDSFKVQFNPNLKILPGFKKYVVNSKEPNDRAILNLCELLRDLFEKGVVFSIHYDNPKLLIDLRTNKIHKKEIAELLKI
jgi:hypothetical protein